MAVKFELDWNKALAAITYIASRDVPELSKGKMCKLVFLTDKYHLVRFGRPVTGDCYYAIPNGPIPSAILKRLDALEEREKDNGLTGVLELDRAYQYPRISAEHPVEMDNLSESDVSALERTLRLFGKMGFAELSAITHAMPAYSKAWERRGGAKSFPMVFEDFFEEDDEAVVGVLEEVIENDLLIKVFAAK